MYNNLKQNNQEEFIEERNNQNKKPKRKRRLLYEIKELTRDQKELYEQLVEIGIPHLIAHAYALRDFTFLTEAYSPKLLKDLDVGVDYMFKALINKEEICVVADYDADGATSCAIMIRGMKMFGQTDNLHYFVPNREIHGYGLQPSVIDDMLNHYPKVKTIITVDNGISAIAGVNYAVEKGIQVVVTDHHVEGDVKPEKAVCIINPNRKDCTFPSKALAGCGVAFYFIRSLQHKFREELKYPEKYNQNQFKIIEISAKAPVAELLDYLAIGTVADVVPLDENNRLLVSYGLKRIRNGLASNGVKALLSLFNFSDENYYKFNTEDIAFKVAPTINAVGRLEDMTMGVRLLLEENIEEAILLANEAKELNEARKRIEQKELDSLEYELQEIMEYELNSENLANKVDGHYLYSCAMLLDNGHEGVIGIIASRIKERLYKPTIVFTKIREKHNGRTIIKGSGRSIPGLHIRDAIDYITKNDPNCVIKYGGHAMAAGLSIYYDKLDVFKKLFDEYCEEVFNKNIPTLVHKVDEELNLARVDIEDIRELNAEIWGQAFTKPIYFGTFYVHKQRQAKNKQTGEFAHLQLELEQNGKVFKAMWFRKKDMIVFDNNDTVGGKLDIIYTININSFNGHETIQLLVIDAVEHINYDDYGHDDWT